MTASETADTTRLNEARVKALTGGDAITASEKYKAPFTFGPVAKFWLASNHLPIVRDDSEGFWRRVRLVEFKRRFSGPERNDRLREELLAEAPGILSWVVRAAVDWYSRGLDTPAAVSHATSAFRNDSDPLAEFIADDCSVSADLEVQASELFEAYLQHSERVGLSKGERLSPRPFGSRLKARFANRHTKRGSVYSGIGLLEGCCVGPDDAT